MPSSRPAKSKARRGLALLGGLTPGQFLRRHWQRKPLLIRAAIEHFRDPLSPDELAGLACESHVESRLVLETGGKSPWQLRYGPFTADDFRQLPESRWTLLVQDIDKHLPALAALLEPFRFIPDWRIDDLMISYAPPYGSVGPHWDEYDVFLLQGQGRRRWQISTREVSADNTLPDAELRIMRRFTPEQEWVLEPGDMLYLPPRVAHYGVALAPCLTYSIGFRAPSHQELVSSFCEHLLEAVDPEARYGDPGLAPQEHPGQITEQALEQVLHVLLDYLSGWEDDSDALAGWFGRFITEPKPAFEAEPLRRPLTLALLKRRLARGTVLRRAPGARLAFFQHATGDASLFISGQEWRLDPLDAWLAPVLCSQHTLDKNLLEKIMAQPASAMLLLEWLNAGYLACDDNDDN
jgi:50S ribosomal protein L16 3-hydroxylase